MTNSAEPKVTFGEPAKMMAKADVDRMKTG